MNIDYTGQVVIVTGSGRGIGLTIAEAFAKSGATLVLSDYNEESLTQAVADFSEKKYSFTALPCNITDAAQVQSLMDSTFEKYQRVDVLVNNAGITRDNILLRMKDDQWNSVIETNLTGAFLTTRAAAKFFLKQQYGRIINIASIVGLIGNPGQGNYAAAKAGLIGFSKAVAKELTGRNITINCIAPGYIETPMTHVLSDKVKEEFMKSIPLKRMGKPEDVANAALFLASPLADYITGQVINVDGGMVM